MDDWQLISYGPIITNVDQCKLACQLDDTKWQFVYFNSSECYCVDIIEYGKFHLENVIG